LQASFFFKQPSLDAFFRSPHNNLQPLRSDLDTVLQFPFFENKSFREASLINDMVLNYRFTAWALILDKISFEATMLAALINFCVA
jgi:hypothetical protein